MVFHSDLFDTHPTYQSLKSHLLDFYNGYALSEMPLTALELVISVTAGPITPSPSSDITSDSSSTPTLPKVHLRVYTIKLLASGSKVPRIALEEMGPSIDFTIRRVQDADDEMMKQALKRPKIAKKDVESGLGKKRKNIETDEMGDRVGKIHIGKQDLNKVQGRKVRALGRGVKKSKPAEATTED